MKTALARFLPALLATAALLSAGGCAATLHGGEQIALQLHTDNIPLRKAARQVLIGGGARIDNTDATLPRLHISETHGSSVDSLAADGSVSGYKITYRLHYRLDDGAPQQIQHVQLIDYSENRYRAGALQQREMVNTLRRSALSQMISALPLR